MRNRSAFTLIELLVVIAVIAVLMAILMPSLKIAREQARAINCMANQRSLAQAYIMYAGDNDGAICGGMARPSATNRVPPWVKPPGNINTDGSFAAVDGDVTFQQRLNGLKAGAIYPFVNEPDVYHCPGDMRKNMGTSLGDAREFLIFRSYSLPDYMTGTSAADAKNLFSFKEQATKMLFVEEIYDGASGNHNVDGWSYRPYDGSLWDPLGNFHSDACTFSFMDGHAERKKWQDKRTVIYFGSRTDAAAQGFGKGSQFSPPNVDLDWLDKHYPGKTLRKGVN